MPPNSYRVELSHKRIFGKCAPERDIHSPTSQLPETSVFGEKFSNLICSPPPSQVLLSVRALGNSVQQDATATLSLNQKKSEEKILKKK